MASPAGRPPVDGAGAPRRAARAPGKASNPLMTRKKPQRPRPPPASGQQTSRQNGPSAPPSGPAPGKTEGRDLQSMPFGDMTPSLFSQAPPAGTFTDFPVVMSKKEIMDGLRHHVARFVKPGGKPIDPRNQSEFTRPLYMLRRDVRAPIPGSQEWEEMQAEQRRREAENAGDVERNAARDAVRAEIAPSLEPKKAKPMRKKANDAITKGQTPEQRAKYQLKYEEALPWHLEDDEQKQIWMGTYEDAASNTWTQLRYESTPQGPRYMLTPLQKWYKFSLKSRLNADQLRQAEARKAGQKVKKEKADPSFWNAFQEALDKEEQKATDNQNALRAGGKGFYVGKLVNDNARNARNNEEELDFEEDWADDEAPPMLEGEETEVKDIEEKIKKDQLKSNYFGQKTLAQYEDEELLEALEEKMRKKVGRKVEKALFKRERNALYESDNENPYSDSDSTDTEAELEREKEKREAEAKEAAAAAAKTKSEQGSRNNTPGSRTSKHPEPLHKAAQSLKRPGSPSLSDASGNESTAARKKLKIKNGSSKLSNLPSRTQSPAPSANGGRPVLPGASRSFMAGSGSDTEGGGPRKLKLSSPRSPGGTPGASRVGSRAGSPAPGAPVRVKKENVPLPQNSEELRPMIPKEGISMPAFLNRFLGIGSDADKKRKLVSMVQEVARYDKPTKLLFPK